jgi:hypothetical protein
VTDSLPTGLTATAITGTGWTCTLATLTCTRSDALASNASYPVITLTVNVASNAPATMINTATGSGGGDATPGNNTATDTATIGEPGPVVLTCTMTAVPATVRAEGLSELVGDLVLNCRGGTPTPAGQPVPQTNLQVFLNTNITSRLSGDFSEALLLVDEPQPGTQLPCGAQGTGDNGSGVCSIVGNGTGVNLYNGITVPNVFQGRQAGVNAVVFAGVPVDPPGSGTRVLRITNLRANASMLGASTTAVPTAVSAFVSSSGVLVSDGSTRVVGSVQTGLSAIVSEPATLLQCLKANPDLISPTAAMGANGQDGQQFTITLTEGFASAWQVKNLAQKQANASGGTSYPPDLNQNIPGFDYTTETGFLNQGFAAVRGLNRAGSADAGTRFSIRFDPVPAGVQLFVPSQVNLVRMGGTVSGTAVLTQEGSFAPLSGTLVGVPVTGSVATAIYEVLYANTSDLETIEIPVAVAWPLGTKPAAGLQSKAVVSFAPVSTIATASESAPIPRFMATQTEGNTFIVNTCACTLLFPFVTSQPGFDTGIAIANTSRDPFGTEVQSGPVTVHYFGGMADGSAPPPPQTTSGEVNGGQQVVFTLSGGGSHGMRATPGFQGYLIVQTQFLYCHGAAFFFGGRGMADGYLGLVLGPKGKFSRGTQSESLSH